MADSQTAKKILTVSSPAFQHNDYIPTKFTCEGMDINPGIIINNVPAETKTLVLIMKDVDAPGGGFYHWVMWNISPGAGISENSATGDMGRNSAGKNKYMGPCPPSGVHAYHFRVYALDKVLTLDHETDGRMLECVMEGHVLATGELVGRYGKQYNI
jgi:Raf kinase inhibitor-like YbhB/YbcL family protein